MGRPERRRYAGGRRWGDVHECLQDDILAVKQRWGMRLCWFLDANFTANLPWLEAFTAVYRRRVSVPVFCKLRPERATERVVRLLVELGCTQEFYRGFARGPSVDAGTAEHLLQACRDLRLE